MGDLELPAEEPPAEDEATPPGDFRLPPSLLPQATLFPASPGITPHTDDELDAKAVLAGYLARNPAVLTPEESRLPDAYFRRRDEMRFEELPLRFLNATLSPIWCMDIVTGRFLWANAAALELWNASKFTDLFGRDFSRMSDTARTRLSSLLQRFRTENPVEQWTFYPAGKSPITLRVRHLPLAIADRPYTCFYNEAWMVESVEPNALRGVEAVHHTPSVIAVYEWLAGKEPPPGAEPPDPRGRPLMRNPAAQRLFGPVRSDIHYYAARAARAASRSASGSTSGDTSSRSGEVSASSDSDEPLDPEFQLGRTIADPALVEEMVSSLLLEGRWQCDEVPLRAKRGRLSFSSTAGDEHDQLTALARHSAAAGQRPDGTPSPDVATEDEQDGIKWYSYDARLTTDPVTGNQVVLVNASDVNERRRMQRALEKAKLEAEAANKSKSMFLANISHDLRTPMTGVLGVVDLLRSMPMTSEQRGYVDTLAASAEVLLALVNDLLDFSKIEAGQLSLEQVPFVLPKLLSDVMDLLRPRALAKELRFSISPELARLSRGASLDEERWREGISNMRGSSGDIVVRVGGSEPKRGEEGWLPGTLVGDSTRLKQVLFNLVGNAIKFTESGGTVSVAVEFSAVQDPQRGSTTSLSGSTRAANADSPDERAELENGREGIFPSASSLEGAEVSRGMLRVTVTDSGIGLTPTQIGNLFQPFSQGDSSMTRRFGGTGLGLAISRRLVELMGGVIGVFSPGANLGSSFWFEIPVLVLEESAAAAEDPDGGITDFIWPTLPAIVRTATEDSTDGTAYAAPAPAVVSKHEDLSLDTSVIAEPAPIGTVDGDRTESEPRTPLSALSASSAELPTPTPLSANHSFGGGSAESSSLNPATRPGSKEPTRFQGRNILLAEDNNVNRLLVTKMLQKLGHTVTAVPDGEQAVEAARKKAAEDYQVAVESNGDTRNVGFEIILMDMMMPVMDGPTATRMIRQFPPHLNPQIPIVALSADALTESRERNQLSGLDSYVTKPVDWARLSRVMDRVIRAKQATRGAQGTGT